MNKPKGLFVLNPQQFDHVFGPPVRQRARDLIDLSAATEPISGAELLRDPSRLADVRLILGSWGMPRFDAALLTAAPRLEAIFYAAGSVHGFVTEALWDRGIIVCAAAAQNAVPVAEYCLSQILFALKGGWRYADQLAHNPSIRRKSHPYPGAYGSTVGIVSLGLIGRLVADLLKPFNIRVIAHDPFVDDADFEALGLERVDLGELFERADVVSLHTPKLPTTRGMIGREYFAAMKPYATFLNTARGEVVRESELVDVLLERGDLWAILDVLDNRDRGSDPRLFDLPNVTLTPHIAGSQGPECQRMGAAMLDELERYLQGRPLRQRVDPARLALTA